MLTLCFCFAVPFPQKRKDLNSLAAYHYDAYDEMNFRSSISLKLVLALIALPLRQHELEI